MSQYFLKILVVGLKNTIQNNGLWGRKQTEYMAGAISLYKLFGFSRCRIIVDAFDDAVTNRWHGFEWCSTQWMGKYVEGKRLGVAFYTTPVFAIFDIPNKTTNSLIIFYGIHTHTLTVKFQENTKKCTVLQYKVFTIQALELRHVSTMCTSFLGSVHLHLYKT